MDNTYPKNISIDRKWLTALSVFTGAIMSTIDAFILYIATPHLRGIFSATIAEISWVSTTYSISALAFMLIASRLCINFGRKRTYQWGLGIFTISSIFCAFSTSLTMLIIARIFQGIGAGILLPTENLIIRKAFPPEEHGYVMGIYGATVMVGPSLGPFLGGYIIDNYHWSLIFFVNVPIGILGYVMVHHFVPEDPPEKDKARIDIPGIFYLVIGLFGLIWLLERGDRTYWFTSEFNIILLFFSLFLLTYFCAHQLSIKNPLVDLRVLKNTIFRNAMILNFLLGFVVTGTLFVLPIYMQDLLEFTPTKAGETLAPRALFMMILFPFIGKIFNLYHPKVLICGGIGLGLISAIMMSHFTHDTGYENILFPQILQGVATVLMIVPILTVGLKAVEPKYLAAAAGVDSLARQLGGSLGIAVFSSLITHYQLFAWGTLRHNVSLSVSVFFKRFGGVFDFFKYEGASDPVALEQAFRLLNGRVHQQVLVITYMNIFQIIALIFAAMFILALIFNLKKK